MAGYEGYAMLGEALSGGGQPTGAAYVDQYGKANRAMEAEHDRNRAMHEARIAQLRSIAREGITTQNLEQAGYQPNVAPLLQALLGSATTPSLNQLGKMQVPGSGQAFADADTAMRAGNLGEYNELADLAAGREHKPLKLGAGGKTVFDPVSGDVDLTPLGEAQVQDGHTRANRAPAVRATPPRSHRGSAPALKEIITRIEAESGRKLSAAEYAKISDDYLTTGEFTVPEGGGGPASLGEAGPALVDPGDGTLPGGAMDKSRLPAGDALKQAREAIAAGAPKEAVRKRLIEAGYTNIAGRL